MTASERLGELGIELPPSPKPLGMYVPAMRSGNLLFLSGMLPLRGGEPAYKGRIGAEISIEAARDAVRLATLNALGATQAAAGSLDAVRSIVRLAVYQRADPGFTQHALVADAGSELLRHILGARAGHARLVFGVLTLPAEMPVELEMILELNS
jgi:enamine deaminase RidA (YjgF/YER057c/UK114 family)